MSSEVREQALSSLIAETRKYLPIVLRGILLTLFFSLFSRYEQGAPYHLLHNGLPLPTLTQVIDPVAGRLVSLNPNPFGIIFDILFFAAVWLLVSRMLSAILQRTPKG